MSVATHSEPRDFHSNAPEIDYEDFSHIDVEGLTHELNLLAKEIRESVGQEDIDHLKMVERWGKICTTLGYATAWMAPNIVSAMLISQGQLTRWLMTHHISHRGYDKVPGIPAKYTSKYFARGKRRKFDWMDWILPEAWHAEHDILHHYWLGEDEDPDLIERNTQWMRDQELPRWQKQALIALLSVTWKWLYYSPSTMRALHAAEAKKAGLPEPEEAELLSPFNARGRDLWKRALLPNIGMRFVAVPAAFLPLGPVASFNVWANTVMADILGNLHAFIVIGPNHSADDLYRFDTPVRNRREFFLRQIIGSANYRTGSDLVDWPQMWLNYQIEHHIWPDMTMLQYRKAQPRVKALCEKYGVPYVEENVFKRAKRMYQVIVGDKSMRWAKTYEANQEGVQRPWMAAAE